MPQNFEPLAFPILIGDIGGTNARFRLIGKNVGEKQIFPTLATVDFANIDQAIAQIVMPQVNARPLSLVLAVAGPVEGQRIALTNVNWCIDIEDLARQFSFKNILILNDFEAQALASAVLDDTHLVKIGGGQRRLEGACAILGPGTGLGVAGLISIDGRLWPLAGEGGHIDFSPRTARDLALFPHLPRFNGRVGMEEVLSGRGLAAIYQAICHVDEVVPHFDANEAGAITNAALQCHQGKVGQEGQRAFEAVQLFLTWLARLAGDFALIFKAHGGTYIGGGIVPQMLPLLDHQSFRQAFDDKAPHQGLLAQMPLFIMTHHHAALEGMARLMREPERFHLNIQGRLWRH